MAESSSAIVSYQQTITEMTEELNTYKDTTKKLEEEMQQQRRSLVDELLSLKESHERQVCEYNEKLEQLKAHYELTQVGYR